MTPTRLGIVVIDVQASFVNSAANAAMTQILANTKTVLGLAGQHKTPLFISFEASKDASSGHNLPADVRATVPGHAREFIKTTFAATSLPTFATAVQQANLTHVVVLGAETDVCVMQTVLGLRAMGLTVILQLDAVFSSEPNTAPALRRMRQAGVLAAGMAQVRSYIEQPSNLPPATTGGSVTILKPLKVAAILNGFSAAALGGATDPHRAAKEARLRELLLLSEWFAFPLYGTVSGAIPASYSGLIKKSIRPVAELAQAAGVEQIIVAGNDNGLQALVASHGKGRDLFIMEDALLSAGATGAQAGVLDGLYTQGAVPLTYKAFYYGMTRSVSMQEWPSAAWVQRDAEYYPKTKAPEELPPII
jgi:nicotinamidase-related amidase